MNPPKLTSARYIEGFRLHLVFSDGLEGIVDMAPELTGGIFEALRDANYFRAFRMQQQFGTIEWDNGADFSPEFLYELTQRAVKLDSAARKTA